MTSVRTSTQTDRTTATVQWSHRLLVIAVIAIAMIVAASVAGVRALLLSQPTPVQVRAVVASDLPEREIRRITPAKAEGPDAGFFVGTGDGGNGFR
jgi:hypothetical protein